MDLIFDRVSYLPTENITGIAPQAGVISVSQLGVEISDFTCDRNFDLGIFPQGAYSITWHGDAEIAVTSAFEVLDNPWDRLRYGFVAEFSDSVSTQSYLSWAKKLHLTAIQFYDWAWRHEFLTTDKLHYGDPLGQDISTEKIKELISGYREIGSTPSGYAAIYAVDAEGWERWKEAGLFDIAGNPYLLGDNFLWILDPANPRWLAHLISQLQKAHEFGFSAFHLDQYGWPKNALKSDGSAVDLAQRFPEMLNEIVKALPDCKHIFNNVNDFPTWSTTQTGQHATYIEVWDPHSTYGHLADLVSKARELNSTKPVILSAYLHAFGAIKTATDEAEAVAAFELTFASIVSGGASHLITGGDGRVLHHAYYVTNYLAPESTLHIFQNYFDFVVASGDLLYDPSRVDVTLTNAFGVNNEIKFICDAPVSPEATPGTLWVRAYAGETGLTLHIINLLDQEDSLWDQPKRVISTEARLTISIEAGGFSDQASIGHTARGATFSLEPMEILGNRLQLSLEISSAWTIVNIPLKKEKN
jgi:dextranase